MFFFHIFLLFFSVGFRVVIYQRFHASFLLYLPILGFIISIGLAAKKLEENKKSKWVNGKRILKESIAFSSLVFLSLVLFTIQEAVKSFALEIISMLLIIIGNLGFVWLFYDLNLTLIKQGKRVIKQPRVWMSASFTLQALAYLLLLVSYIKDSTLTTITNTDIISLISAFSSLIPMLVAAIRYNISFRAYPLIFKNNIELD